VYCRNIIVLSASTDYCDWWSCAGARDRNWRSRVRVGDRPQLTIRPRDCNWRSRDGACDCHRFSCARAGDGRLLSSRAPYTLDQSHRRVGVDGVSGSLCGMVGEGLGGSLCGVVGDGFCDSIRGTVVDGVSDSIRGMMVDSVSDRGPMFHGVSSIDIACVAGLELTGLMFHGNDVTGAP